MRCAVKMLEDFKEGTSRKSQTKPQKTAEAHLFGPFMIQDLYQNLNKTLFNHCLLHFIRLRGLGENKNAKTAFKT